MLEHPVDVEAPRPPPALEPALPSKPASRTWRDSTRVYGWPSLYAIVATGAYASLVVAWYHHQIAHARPPPYQLGDTEQAGSQARLIGALAPFAGVAGAALGASMHGGAMPVVKPPKHAHS